MRISDEQGVEIHESAGKVGCWTVLAFLIFLILSICSGGSAFFVVLTVLTVIIMAICILAQKAVEKQVKAVNTKRREEFESKKKKEEETKRIAKENAKILNYYDQCIKEGVSNLDTEKNKQKALLISKQLSLTTEYTIAYSRGKIMRVQHDKEAQEAHFKQLKKDEHEQYIQLTKYSSFIGRDKKIRMLNDLIAPYKSALAEIHNEENKARDAFIKGPELKAEHDWAIQGGMASGLAGGAAGVMVALNAQQENEKIRAWNREATNINTQYVLTTMKYVAYKEAEIRKELDPLENELEKAKIALVENSDEQELLDNLKFDNVTVKFSETGAFTITAYASNKKNNIMFENTKAFIDGTVKANLYQNGKCVGNTFLVAPINGFYGELQGICLADFSTAKKDEPYEIKFEPYHLWKIEV